jgi:hypothetical protein
MTRQPTRHIAGGQTVSKTVTATLTSGNPGDAVTAGLQLSTADGTCDTAGSACSGSDSDTIAAPVSAKEWITNPSFETNITGWIAYNTSGTLARVTTDAYDGLASAQVLRTAVGAGIAGLSSKTHWVGSTVAGTPYTASAYVRPGTTGQSYIMLLKEFNSSGAAVGTTKTTLTATSTAWQQLRVTYTAAGSGNYLVISLYASNLATNDGFRADLLSITSPN